MLTVNSQVLHRLLKQICAVLGLKRSSSQPVTIGSDGRTTTVYTAVSDCTVECELVLPNSPLSITLPLSVLLALPSSSRHDVKFQVLNDQVLIEYWQSGRWNKLQECQAKPGQRLPSPEVMLEAGTDFGRALFAASRVTDNSSTRYVLGCIRLRGRDGQIAATDARQAFVQSGFSLPLDEVLLPAARISKMRQLAVCNRVATGVGNNWLQLQFQAGLVAWRVNICTETTGRFPTLDQCFGNPSSCQSTITLARPDCQFILDKLPIALGKQQFEPITLEAHRDRLSGRNCVSLRFDTVNKHWLSQLGIEGSQSQSNTVEVELSHSEFSGLEGRVAISHLSLMKAVELGFQHIHMFSYPAPLLCHQPSRMFTFTQFDAEMTKLPGTEKLRIQTSLPLVAA